MSFADCIVNNAALTPKQKDALVNEYTTLFDRYRASMGDETAAAVAAQKYVGIKTDIIVRKKENAIRDVLAWQRLNGQIDVSAGRIADAKKQAGKGGFLWGKSNVAAATRTFLENVYTRHQALERRATLALGEAIERYRSKNAGLTQDVEGFTNVVRAVLGEKAANDVASSDAKALKQVFDNLHKMYEQSGGILGKLDNYFPQSHNPQLVGRVSFDTWKGKIWDLLDRERMIDVETGLPMTDARLNEALKNVYEGIKTNGLDELAIRAEAGLQTHGGSGMAMRRSSSRFLHFKDAESFLTYNREFGYGDSGLFNAMMGHITTMTRDIAIMQEMGPNPGAQIERLKLKIEADGAGPQAVKTVGGMYDVLAGRTSATGELPGWYRGVQNVQNWLRSSYLGSAPVAAMSDSFYVAWTGKMNGLPATGVMKQYLSILNPANPADRRIARRIGFIAGSSSGNSIAQARFMDDSGGNGMTAWLASFTNRASALAVMTDTARQAPVLATQGFMAEAKAARLSWDNLDPAMKDAFARWGMDQSDYKKIMSARPWVDEGSASNYGADFIRPEDVALAGHADTAAKYEMWLVDMAQAASNEPRLLTRAIATGAFLGDAKPGTILRATAGSLMMFKSFGITVILNHMLPSLRHAATARGMDRLAMLAPVLVGTTLLGAMTVQTRQVVQGKTARDMDNHQFWMSAAMQGGGFGIFGDFLFSDQSRFNSNFDTTLLGPVYGLGKDGYRVFKGNFDKALDEDSEAKFFSDLFQFGERNIPAVKLWYTRLLLERTLLDQTERMIDPNFDTRIRRIESRMKDESGQEFWWSPGQ